MLARNIRKSKDGVTNLKDALNFQLGIILTAMLNSKTCSSDEIILMGAYVGADFILSSDRGMESIDKQEILHQIFMTYHQFYPYLFTPTHMQKITSKLLELLTNDPHSIRSYIQDAIISNVVIE